MGRAVFFQVPQSVVALAPLYSATLARAEVIVASKRGPRVAQPYRDLAKWRPKSSPIGGNRAAGFGYPALRPHPRDFLKFLLTRPVVAACLVAVPTTGENNAV